MPTTDETALNEIIGRNVRIARTAAGESQETLGAALGLTFQQIQKYEKGKNCVKPFVLSLIAARYRRPIAWFFSQAGAEVAPMGQQQSRQATYAGRALAGVPERLREPVLGLLKALAEPEREAAE